MANIKSKIKRHSQDEKKRSLNHSKNSEVRTTVKKTRASKSKKDLDTTYSVVDKGTKNNRIHKNKANRLKSRTAKATNAKA